MPALPAGAGGEPDLMRVYVAGYKGAGAAGGLIRWYTFGGYSHVSLVFDHGEAGVEEIDAMQLRGVTSRVFGELAGAVDLFHVPCGEQRAAVVYAAARELLGMGYDWTGLWSFLRRRKRENPNRWFCSELVAWCLLQAGIVLQRLPVWKHSPVLVCASVTLRRASAPRHWGDLPAWRRNVEGD